VVFCPGLVHGAAVVVVVVGGGALQEREAVMCSVAHSAAQGVLPGMTAATTSMPCNVEEDGPSSSPAREACCGPVVLVVGAAHLPGEWV
jgi:hypothetical protein